MLPGRLVRAGLTGARLVLGGGTTVVFGRSMARSWRVVAGWRVALTDTWAALMLNRPRI